MIKKLNFVYASVIKKIKAYNETNLDCPDCKEKLNAIFNEFDLRFYDFGL